MVTDIGYQITLKNRKPADYIQEAFSRTTTRYISCCIFLRSGLKRLSSTTRIIFSGSFFHFKPAQVLSGKSL
ncbi:hypothetical protein B1H10_08875 [candidate division KSB1 bacterium 4484_188]|nr:MAG: hypothetical protein B1H10_08875 [candidate division KSB1 bacterium 4484_188]